MTYPKLTVQSVISDFYYYILYFCVNPPAPSACHFAAATLEFPPVRENKEYFYSILYWIFKSPHIRYL